MSEIGKLAPSVIAKKIILFALGSLLLASFSAAEAQQSTRIPRIGYLQIPTSPNPARIEAFRQGLRELGYVEGKNIVIEYRSSEGKPDRLPALAAELVRLKVDVIVTSGATVTRAAKEASLTIPIVMRQDPDPVGNGFVASLARPGGNITGLATFRPETTGKRLELLKEIVPKLFRVTVLGSSTMPGNAQAFKETDAAAGVFGVELQYLDILGPRDIEPTFRAASKGRADALLMMAGSVLLSQRTQIADLAIKEPPAGDILRSAIRRSRGAYDLWRELHRFGPTRRYVCGQNPQGRQARRSAGGAADQIRAGDQSQNGQTDRPHDTAVGSVSGG
jgi:putative tryptophan/tyrosine transport system substrate-binding protein